MAFRAPQNVWSVVSAWDPTWDGSKTSMSDTRYSCTILRGNGRFQSNWEGLGCIISEEAKKKEVEVEHVSTLAPYLHQLSRQDSLVAERQRGMVFFTMLNITIEYCGIYSKRQNLLTKWWTFYERMYEILWWVYIIGEVMRRECWNSKVKVRSGVKNNCMIIQIIKWF